MNRKSNYFTVLIIILISFPVLSWGQDFIVKDISLISEFEGKRWENLTAVENEDASNDFDITYHKINWTINPNYKYISGSVLTQLTSLSSGLDTLYFDLADNMIVDDIRYNGNYINHYRKYDEIIIPLSKKLNEGEKAEVIITYRGAPRNRDFFTKSTHNGIPVIWTNSEPTGSATWWPCKMSLTDKIDSIDVYVETPNQYEVAGNGLLEVYQETQSTRTWHWKHRYPIATYLIFTVVTDYAIEEKYHHFEDDSLLMLNYFYKEDSLEHSQDLEDLTPIFDLYVELLGDYPFMNEKYGHAQYGWGGAMENQTMSAMGTYRTDIQAHELVHHWFGDKVTCAKWEDLWINEGLTSYYTGLIYENLYDSGVWEYWKAITINEITRLPYGSVIVPTNASWQRLFNSRLTYQKGAMVTHMIRGVLGDEVFFKAMRDFVNNPSRDYDFASTEDFRKHLEAASGIDLKEFFNDWLYGQGHPSYALTYEYRNGYLELVLDQTTSDISVPFFEMPVPIYVEGEDQDTTLILDHIVSGQTFIEFVDFEPVSITIDPEQWIISQGNVVTQQVARIDEPSTHELTFYPNPVSNVLTIQLDQQGNANEVLKCVVADSKGAIVKRQEFQVNDLLEVECSDLARGIYQVSLTSEKTVMSFSFVKE